MLTRIIKARKTSLTKSVLSYSEFVVWGGGVDCTCTYLYVISLLPIIKREINNKNFSRQLRMLPVLLLLREQTSAESKTPEASSRLYRGLQDAATRQAERQLYPAGKSKILFFLSSHWGFGVQQFTLLINLRNKCYNQSLAKLVGVSAAFFGSTKFGTTKSGKCFNLFQWLFNMQNGPESYTRKESQIISFSHTSQKL